MFACRTSLRTVVLNSYFGIFCFLRFLVVLEANFFLKKRFLYVVPHNLSQLWSVEVEGINPPERSILWRDRNTESSGLVEKNVHSRLCGPLGTM